jgi:hypothetical protein
LKKRGLPKFGNIPESQSLRESIGGWHSQGESKQHAGDDKQPYFNGFDVFQSFSFMESDQFA